MIGSERIRSWSRPIIQASSPLIFSVTLLFVMAKTKDVEAVRRALRVARAEFARDIGNLEATIKRRIPKCKKSLKKVRGLEKRGEGAGGGVVRFSVFQGFSPRGQWFGQLQRLQRK